MKKFDIVCGALPGRLGFEAMKAAIEAKTSMLMYPSQKKIL